MDLIIVFLYKLLFVMIVNILTVNADLYTAVEDLEPLLASQKRVMEIVDDYLKKEENRFIEIKRYSEWIMKQNEITTIKNLNNPINAFTFLKRLTMDTEFIEKKIIGRTGRVHELFPEGSIFIAIVKDGTIMLPPKEDIIGAGFVLWRVQNTYQLNVSDIARGLLKGIHSTPMTVGDCYEMAKCLYKLKYWPEGIVWLEEALKKYRKKQDKGYYPFLKEDILEHLGYGYHVQEDNRNAMKYVSKILEMRPGDPRYKNHMASIDYFQDMIDKEVMMRQHPAKFAKFKPKYLQKPEMTPQSKLMDDFEAVCRGDKRISRDVAKRLTCRYMTESHNFFKLAPVKMEQLYILPDVYMFHNVISDSEIEYLKNQARHNLTRGLIYVGEGRTGPSLHRINKISWLDDSDVVKRINRRISHVTGLSIDSAEDLQVVAYGSAGYYDPHYDIYRNKTTVKSESARLATFMFYLSDVTLGGGTAFIRLGLNVLPVKGSAIFWYNHHPSGQGDLAMLHGACPVIHGIKWILIKWIHAEENEFTRPCTLEYQPEGIFHTIKRSVKKKMQIHDFVL